MARAADIIAIHGLKVDCVVGVYPRERDRVQPLGVDVELRIDTRRAGARERLSETIDYAFVANQIAFLLRSSRFFMLETAARALSRLLLAPPAVDEKRAPVESATVRLTKPYALAGHGVPSLEIHRERGEMTFEHEIKPFGKVDIIDETRHVGIYRLNVGPGLGIPLHHHQRMDESEMVLTDGLLCQDKPVVPGTVFRWPRGALHRYQNPTERWQSILCVDSPPFEPADEIEADGEPADIRPQAPFIPTPPEPLR